jgi:quinoprotein glucose dehydrogenase
MGREPRGSQRIVSSAGDEVQQGWRFEVTPLMAGGLLYVTTPLSEVLGLDPRTGRLAWSYDPEIPTDVRYAEGFTARGAAFWRDSETTFEPCSTRVFAATLDGRLVALDARTGKPCRQFGVDGAVSLLPHDVDRRRVVALVSVTSPPTVAGDIVVVGSAVSKLGSALPPPATVRAYSARTGTLEWEFSPSAAPTAVNASRSGQAAFSGGNVWSVMTADPSTGLLFLPTASPYPQSYGAVRPGRNEYANSVVALEAATGEVRWSFQAVHHDLWDYDVATQPILVGLRRAAGERLAVLIGTKTGMVFVLDRVTGEPVFPVVEQRVPESDVPGETAWPTQPFPSFPPLLHPTMLTPGQVFGLDSLERASCRSELSSLRNDGLFTPPSLQGSVAWPGFWGGLNWDALAWDDERDILLANVKNVPAVLQLIELPTAVTAGASAVSRYQLRRRALVSPRGLPCSPPPWGVVLRLSLRSGETLWRRPIGLIPGLADTAGGERLGSLLFGGPLVTGGGLLFIGASQDGALRAINVKSGEVLWHHKLPAGGQAAPMTYRYGGRQYVVIVAGGRGGIGVEGDWVVAFAVEGP